jgi:hypothetical protein
MKQFSGPTPLGPEVFSVPHYRGTGQRALRDVRRDHMELGAETVSLVQTRFGLTAKPYARMRLSGGASSTITRTGLHAMQASMPGRISATRIAAPPCQLRARVRALAAHDHAGAFGPPGEVQVVGDRGHPGALPDLAGRKMNEGARGCGASSRHLLGGRRCDCASLRLMGVDCAVRARIGSSY